jgi:hypothetical protein
MTKISAGTGTWYATVTNGSTNLSPAGYWYIFVSRPLFQFILIRWYFRLFIWARFLWQSSQLDLNLIPTHPDRATGLGFPLIATPTVALLLDIRIAVTILILPNLLMDITQVFRDGFPYPILQRFKSMIGLTIIGVFLGTMVLVLLPLWALNLCLGIMVLVFVTSNLLKLDFTIPPAAEKILSPMVGFLSGFLNGMTNAAGPVLAIYFYSLKLEKRTSSNPSRPSS